MAAGFCAPSAAAQGPYVTVMLFHRHALVLLYPSGQFKSTEVAEELWATIEPRSVVFIHDVKGTRTESNDI